MKRDYQLFIRDIIAAMESIEEFVGNMTLEELKSDEKTSSAVIRKFEIIGEAAKHIHAYFGIDYKLQNRFNISYSSFTYKPSQANRI